MPISKKNIQTKKIKTILLLTLIVILGLFLRIFFFNGVGISDPLEYSRYAHAMSTGNFPPKEYDHGIGRIGLIMPVSLSYYLFGVNEISSVLFPLLTSIGEIILIFFFAKLMFDEKVGLIAAFLLSVFPLDVVNSTNLLSDVPSAFFVGLSVFIFLKAEKISIGLKSRSLYFLSGIFFGIAYMIREMAILMALFFLIYSIYKRKIKIEYLFLVFGFLIILFIDMSIFYHYTGDPLFKIHKLNSPELLQLLKDLNYYGRNELLKFFLTWPFVIFGGIQLGYFYLFISLAAFYWLLHRKEETNYLLIWFLPITLYLYLGTQSLRTYTPFFAVGRYLTLITFPGLLLLAAFLYEKNKLLRKFILPFALIFLFLTSIGAIYLEVNKTLYGIEKSYGVKSIKETYKNKVYSLLKSFSKPIYTDERSINILRYVSQFDKNLNLIDYDLSQRELNSLKGAYIMINNNEAVFGKHLTAIPSNWVKVNEIGDDTSSSGGIVIYYAR